MLRTDTHIFFAETSQDSLKRSWKNAYKVSVAITYVKNTLSTFRTEERRRVSIEWCTQ